MIFSFRFRGVSLLRMASGASIPKGQNRLALEKSPYLLQHASNPVDWYPWGEEAFEKARKENKPIFLSVGYSTCHWCHVMERESFENPAIGKLLNDNFVSVKVDREERPDVDKVYMTFIQATQGGGGWPMSVFLTPDLKPFVGGTYFPPEDAFYGRPGFPTILKSIAAQWSTNRDGIVAQGSKVIEVLSKAVSSQSADSALPGTACIQRGYDTLEKRFDSEYGGFGKAPKFPQPCILNFLLGVATHYPSSSMGETARDMTLATLRAMANGGIHDHVAQGFHRYSTDKFWHVPHFEKMLYDQAQLASIYSAAYQISKEEFFAEVVRDIVTYVSRDLKDKDGGFYSAEDADSYPTQGAEHKKEGAFCVWSHSEICSVLTDPLPGNSDSTTAELFCSHYGVEEKGNVAPEKDPHNELTEQNVLIVRGSITETATRFSLEESLTKQLLADCREKLYSVRQSRPKPHRDDKILTAWNGLMISGLAHASMALGDHTYLELAQEAAKFIRNNLYKEDSGKLIRNAYRDGNGTLGVGGIDGFADDYAFLVRGLLDLYEACQDESWLEWACQLQDKMADLFWDTEKGGYFTATSEDPSILIRMKDDQDGAEPSSNSVAAANLQRISAYLNKSISPKPEAIYQAFAEMMFEHPVAVPELVAAFIGHIKPPKQIIIVGNGGSSDTKELLELVHSRFIPHKILIVQEPDKETFLSCQNPLLKDMVMVDGKATVYVCENFSCSSPTNDKATFKKLLAS